MNDKILKYLTKEHVGVLSNLLPDGSVHGATLHFSHNVEPLEIYFSTENTSRKCEGLLNGEVVKASLVIGFSESEWITLQLDGEITAVSDKPELEAVHRIHYSKHPGSEKYKNDPVTIFLKFTPLWYRYTDYNTDPLTVISSEKDI